MQSTSPEAICDQLSNLEKVDASTGAALRQKAQEMLADPNISFTWRQAIADRLNQAHRILGKHTVSPTDSY